jgi:hypothetical protein
MVCGHCELCVAVSDKKGVCKELGVEVSLKDDCAKTLVKQEDIRDSEIQKDKT